MPDNPKGHVLLRVAHYDGRVTHVNAVPLNLLHAVAVAEAGPLGFQLTMTIMTDNSARITGRNGREFANIEPGRYPEFFKEVK